MVHTENYNKTLKIYAIKCKFAVHLKLTTIKEDH